MLYIPIRIPCRIQAFSKHFRLMLLVGQLDFNKGVGCLAAFVHNWQIARSLYLDPHFARHFALEKMLGHTDKPAHLLRTTSHNVRFHFNIQFAA